MLQGRKLVPITTPESRTMNRLFLTLVLLVIVFPQTEVNAMERKEKAFAVHPIGHVQKSEDRALIVIDEKYQPGLLGLAGWSHVQVIWWFDKNDTPQKRAILQVHPRGDGNNPLTGVFACRAPVRPNLIALSLCKLVSVNPSVA